MAWEFWTLMHTIWPAPITPSFLTSAAAPTEGDELKARHCCLTAHRTACLEATENMMSIAGRIARKLWKTHAQHVMWNNIPGADENRGGLAEA
jgi:hypothetical protein